MLDEAKNYGSAKGVFVEEKAQNQKIFFQLCLLS